MDKLKCWERKRSQAWTCSLLQENWGWKGRADAQQTSGKWRETRFFLVRGPLLSSWSYRQSPGFIFTADSHIQTHILLWGHPCSHLCSHLNAQAKHSPVGFSKQFPTRVVQGWSFFHLLWEQLLLAITSDMIWKYIDPSLIHYEYSHRNIKTVCMHLCTVMHTKYALGCLVMLIPTKG